MSEKVCGADRELVERFLLLIRNNYGKVDEARFFLEQKTGVASVPAMANVRDVVSHLASLLSRDTPDDKRFEQLANAEEHLRRAIIEPYETALNKLTVQFEDLYEQYKAKVVPIQHRHADLGGAPAVAAIEKRLDEIQHLSSNGRFAKAKNLWDSEWEEGVASFIEGYGKLAKLRSELEEYFNRAEQIIRDENHQAELSDLKRQVDSASRHSSRLTVWGIVATVLVGVLAIAVSIVSIMLFRSS